MELDRRGAELLFQVLAEREEQISIAIASNESFSGWTKPFTDPPPRLCAAIVDRPTFNGTISETGASHRLAHMRKVVWVSGRSQPLTSTGRAKYRAFTGHRVMGK